MAILGVKFLAVFALALLGQQSYGMPTYIDVLSVTYVNGTLTCDQLICPPSSCGCEILVNEGNLSNYNFQTTDFCINENSTVVAQQTYTTNLASYNTNSLTLNLQTSLNLIQMTQNSTNATIQVALWNQVPVNWSAMESAEQSNQQLQAEQEAQQAEQEAEQMLQQEQEEEQEQQQEIEQEEQETQQELQMAKNEAQQMQQEAQQIGEQLQQAAQEQAQENQGGEDVFE
ncbi:ras-interacting protein RIP3-like [Teleopsis dalmanni]|uniref:ras-interacting protein RIP3-like n=1 Tax=Teleopsis dalmanni TaxID=139649 RepID=UPI0018CEC62F|nr:ras-interacting protein RIP3-like [Teleopsis dalmanni]XP_037954072.1 ras-interacting protein RIP3-like [Teleopsis dalmanni]